MWLLPEDQLKALQRQAEIAQYYQRRNASARRSHTKTTREQLKQLDITLEELPSCRPPDD